MKIVRIFHPGPLIWPLHRRTPPANQPFYTINRENMFSLSFRGSLASPASFLRRHASFQQGNIWTVLNGDHTCAHQQRKITAQPSIGSYLESNHVKSRLPKQWAQLWKYTKVKHLCRKVQHKQWMKQFTYVPGNRKAIKNICAENMQYETTMRAKKHFKDQCDHIYLCFTSRITLRTWQLRIYAYISILTRTWLLITCGLEGSLGFPYPTPPEIAALVWDTVNPLIPNHTANMDHLYTQTWHPNRQFST